jgi:hypothetical protein
VTSSPGDSRSAISECDDDAAFLAFLGATNQKAIEAEVLSTLIGDLAEAGAVLPGARPIELYMPGIGEGIQAQGAAEGIHRIAGRAINVHGTDISESLTRVAQDRLASEPHIERVDLEVGDVFAPGAILARDIDVALVSHLLYFADSEEAVSSFVANLVGTLGERGVAILVHEAPGSGIATLRSRFVPGFIASPSSLVVQAAAAIGLPVLELEYSSSFVFPSLGADALLGRRSGAAGPGDAQGAEQGLLEARRLACFIFRRAAAEMAEAGELEGALEALLESRDPDTGEVEVVVRGQVIPSPELAADRVGMSGIEAGVELTRSRVAEIARRHPNPRVAVPGS